MCRRWFFIPAFIIFLGILVFISPASTQVQPGLLTGTIKDPNGAVVTNAQVSVRNEATGQTQSAVTDGAGRFRIDGLAPGSYLITVVRDGFKSIERKIVIEGDKPASVEIQLEIAETHEEVTIPTRGSIAPNSDPNYRAMRDSRVAENFEVTDLTLKRDVGTITLRRGSIGFLPPVLGKTVIGVFTGDGEFNLTPLLELEKQYLKMLTGNEKVTEAFDRLVIVFTDQTYEEIKKTGQATTVDPRTNDVLRRFHDRMRSNTERPRSMIHALFSGEDIDNLEATVLSHLYNPRREPFFMAFIDGRDHHDLRFYLRPEGALPQLLSPEEVALVNFDPQGKEEGIWYMSHPESEWRNGKASSGEDKRLIDAENYRIETVITGEKLTATCELSFLALVDGERVLRFGLLPSLRVTRVSFGDKDIGYIQEKKNEDSSFYAILPDPVRKGQKYKINIEYQGNKVIEDAGGGNFAVGARTSWYPSVNAFNDRATFDVTFKVPNRFVLVGVGKQVNESREGDFNVSRWVSEIPLAVAGFNYGRFKKKDVTDDQSKYVIEGYATSELPSYLKLAGDSIGGMSPTRLTDNAIVEAQNSIRIFKHWFGESPYGRIAITQQPQMNFGQSWPTLVYLPIISFFDSTQRWQLFGIQQGLTDFIQEVTSHEVAHQWWGHIVGWSSYHDQWLSEGFADFSAGLYLQYTQGGKIDRYLKFWETQRQAILEKNQFGMRHNDAGPIWMGLRLNTAKTPGAYNRLVYPKGSYILHMLRWMMYEQKTGDQRFIAMMRDFVKNHYNNNATTESFKFIVEKHMTPNMDLDGNKGMNWFFSQWVYGTEIPRYRLDYALVPESGGNVVLTGKVTQSDVSPGFRMIVPIYLDFDGQVSRLGQIAIAGSTTTSEFQVKLPKRPKRVLINYHHDILATESISNGK